MKAAADSVPGDILTEEVIPHPVGPYGESKIKAEEYILKTKNQEPRARTKKIYILRPCMIHGPGKQGKPEPSVQCGQKRYPMAIGRL